MRPVKVQTTDRLAWVSMVIVVEPVFVEGFLWRVLWCQNQRIIRAMTLAGSLPHWTRLAADR